jgi:hypothetical protein
MSRLQRFGVAVGLLLLLAYAVPLFAPPPALWPLPPPATAGLWQRIFPGVPPWWVVGRLVCLLLGAGTIALCMNGPLPLRLGAVAGQAPSEHLAPSGTTRAGLRTALSLALAQAVAGVFAARFNRIAETLYFFFLAVPAAVVLRAEATKAKRLLCPIARRSAVLIIVPLLWLACVAPAAWRSPRAASVVDMWIMVERIEDVVLRHHRILADSASPGHSNAYMMLEGVPLIGPHGLPVSFTQLQCTHLIWAVVCAVGIGAAAWWMVGLAAGVVAQAVFLFSQYVLSSAYSPGPALIAPLCAVLLLLLVLAVREFRSPAALVAFGAVAGFSTTEPTVVLIVLLLCGVMVYSASRFARVPWLAVGVAVLSFAAAVLPAFPHPETLVTMAQQYTLGHRQLVGMVQILYGQQTPYVLAETLNAGHPGRLDIPLGTLLAPFAIARTPLRLLGDTLLDPAGTGLMALGLTLCALQVTRNRAAALLLALLMAGLAHALTSTGDAVSYNRLAGALLPLALFAALGFESLRRACVAGLRPTAAGMLTAGLIAAAGLTTFEVITPALLPASWVATSLEALGGRTPNADAVLIEHGGPWNLSWLYVRHMAALLPVPPLPTLPFSEFERVPPQPADTARVYFWSPGLEAEAAVARTMCARWPGAALYTLTDAAGLYSAFAVSPQGATWRPRLPQDRWAVSFCEGQITRPPGDRHSSPLAGAATPASRDAITKRGRPFPDFSVAR